MMSCVKLSVVGSSSRGVNWQEKFKDCSFTESEFHANHEIRVVFA